MDNKLNLIIIILITFFVTLLVTKKLISVLTKKKIGQKILEIGPNWHKSKEGTPTMGGLSFVVAFISSSFVYIALLICQGKTSKILSILIVVIFALINSLVGIVDDVAKIKKNKNEGLKPLGKLMLQSISAIILLCGLGFSGRLDTVIKIPFFNIQYDIGIFYYFIAFLVICGFINAVNLTDGIDGLASSVSLTSGVFICGISVMLVESEGLILLGSTIVGVTFAFLFFNLHPAKIFMGDTGSLFLGALIVGSAFLMNNILLLVLYGFVFLCEAISVILQVLFFKISGGKRLFKMAPLHHHLEKSGWSEMKIVIAFTLVNALFCIFAYASAMM